MIEMRAEVGLPQVRQQPTVQEQHELAKAAGLALEALVSRLRTDEKFAEEFAARPRSALGAAGIVLQKEGIEYLMTHDPDRFDVATDALFGLMSPDVLQTLAAPSCDPPGSA